MIKCNSLFITLLLTIFPTIQSYAQLSVHLDSLCFHSISDYGRRIEAARSGHPIFVENDYYGFDFEDVLSDGPIVSVYGELINETDSDCIIKLEQIKTLNSDIKCVIETIIYLEYEYKGRVEIVKDALSSINTFNTDGQALMDCQKTVLIGDTILNIYVLHPNSSIKFWTFCPLLKNSKWDKIIKNSGQLENLEINIKAGRKMERIAKEIFPSIRVNCETRYCQ